VTRTLGLYRRPAIWRAMRQRAMGADYSWQRTVPAYMSLYRSLLPGVVHQEQPAPGAVHAPRPSLLEQVAAAALGSPAGAPPISVNAGA
jgi:starch synthase